MGREDKLLKEAFLIYQNANAGEARREENNLPDIGCTDGVEDKIYHFIERLHITNPRVKARRIKLAVVIIFVLCLLAGFLPYHQAHRSFKRTAEEDK